MMNELGVSVLPTPAGKSHTKSLIPHIAHVTALLIAVFSLPLASPGLLSESRLLERQFNPFLHILQYPQYLLVIEPPPDKL